MYILKISYIIYIWPSELLLHACPSPLRYISYPEPLSFFLLQQNNREHSDISLVSPTLYWEDQVDTITVPIHTSGLLNQYFYYCYNIFDC